VAGKYPSETEISLSLAACEERELVWCLSTCTQIGCADTKVHKPTRARGFPEKQLGETAEAKPCLEQASQGRNSSLAFDCSGTFESLGPVQ